MKAEYGAAGVRKMRGEEFWASAAERRTWEELWSRGSDAVHCQLWGWQSAYWRFRNPRSPLFVLRIGETEPLLRAVFERTRDVESGMRKLCFLGNTRADYNVMLTRPDLPVEVGVEALEHLVKIAGRSVPFIEFQNVPAESWSGRVVKALYERLPRNRTSLRTRGTFAIDLPGSVDKYISHLGAGTRWRLRHDIRRLESAHKVDFRVYRDACEECLQVIESIDRARWGAESRYRVPARRQFERAIARAMAEQGIYVAFVLILDGRPAAFVWGSVVRGRLLHDRTGYDRALPRELHVGMVVNFYGVRHAIQMGLRVFDLTRGRESYKQRLGAAEHTNLHIRIYRSVLDRRITKSCEAVVARFLYSRTLQRAFHELRGGRLRQLPRQLLRPRLRV
jgi:CelD/BcsL family acetyltransferase involved in cellulose biosynthesis